MLSKGEIVAMIENMSPQDREEFMLYFKTANEKIYYQLNPDKWAVDKLGIRPETIEWSMNPGYLESGRINKAGLIIPDGWDGTPNPVYAIMKGLAEWRDTVCESSTGTGKTFIAAVLMLWFLDCFPESKVIAVAPKKDQLEGNLWGELLKLKPKFELIRPGVEFLNLQVRIRPGDNTWRAVGFVASVGADEEVSSKTAGMHAEHMLFVLDETQGIDGAILEAIENTCTAPHNLRLALGNPRSRVDSLHKLFIRKDFVSVRISSMDHPNVVANEETADPRTHKIIIPGAVAWKSILTRRNKYGPEPEFYENHPLYKALVRGIVPSGSIYSMFTERTLQTLDLHLEQHPVTPIYYKEHKNVGEMEATGWTKQYHKARHTHVNRYCIFADVAGDKAGSKRDWHAAIVLDRVTLGIVAAVHMQGHRKLYAKELLYLASEYRVYDHRTDEYILPIINWEKDAVGALHLIDDFAEYENLYIHRKLDNPKQKKLRKTYGWNTNVRSRREMLEELEDWGVEVRDHPQRVPDTEILAEMKVFIYNEEKSRYEAASGENDDFMLALAGALITHKVIPVVEEIPPPPPKGLVERQKIEQELLRKFNAKRREKKGTSWDRAKLPKTLG